MNRHPIAQWEITFPQSGGIETKESFSTKFPPSHYNICCEEEHKDGGVHLHLGIKFIKGITHSKLIKWLESKWPNDWKRIHISPIKNFTHFENYCNKEDPNVVINGTIEKVKKMTKEDFENHFWSVARFEFEDDANKRAHKQLEMAKIDWMLEYEREKERLNILDENEDTQSDFFKLWRNEIIEREMTFWRLYRELKPTKGVM